MSSAEAELLWDNGGRRMWDNGGRRIHESVEDTKLSTNKQHTLSRPRSRPPRPGAAPSPRRARPQSAAPTATSTGRPCDVSSHLRGLVYEGHDGLGTRKAGLHTGMLVETFSSLLKTVVYTPEVGDSSLILHQATHLDHAGLT